MVDFHYAGSGVFVDKAPLDEDELARVMVHDWSPKLAPVKVHPFVKFTSLERAYYGLSVHLDHPGGGPKSYENPPVESVDVGNTTFEGIAHLWDWRSALEALRLDERWSFEESPFIEVENEKDYAEILQAIGAGVEPQDWSPKGQNSSSWTGPGVYDLRERPPSRHSESVEKYEQDAMEYEADTLLDYMFQGEEWENSLRELLQEYLDNH